MSLTSSNAIRILLIHDTQNDAEPLCNAIRNSGQAVRSHFLASVDELRMVIEDQCWDLMIAKLNTQTLDAYEAVSSVQKEGKDIPIIGLVDHYDEEQIERAIDKGMADVVVESSLGHLTKVVKRESAMLLNRRDLRSYRAALKETEKRCQLLLESSVDAIGYVHEGMHIFANSAYMDLFGYNDMEDLQCTPIMDLVSANEVDKLKQALKTYKPNESAHITSEGQHSDGSKFQIQIAFSGATYEGEPCTQVVIRRASTNNAALEAELKEARSIDVVSGFYNRLHFDELLNKGYQQVLNTGKRQIVVHIGIANFNEIKSTVSIAGTDSIIADVSKQLRQAVNDDTELLARYSDDMFAAIEVGMNLEKAQNKWQNIQTHLNNYLFEFEGKTIKVNIVCGFAHVDESCSSGNDALVNADQAYNQAIKEGIQQKYFDKSDIANLADNSISNKIKHALAHDGIKIQFQPIMSLRGDSKEHYDILTRVLEKDGTDISPEEFLPSLENSELSGQFDRWVVQNSLKVLSGHLKNGHQTQIMIHITSASIKDPTFLPWVNSQLREHNIPGNSVCFQLPEKTAHTYLKAAKSFSKGLSLLKCELSINNFGLFENGIELTSHLDISYARVDHSFLDGLLSGNTEASERLAALLLQIHQNDINSIVPKIEQAEILSSLWEMGVNYIQGYYLQEPLDDMDYNFDADEEEAV